MEDVVGGLIDWFISWMISINGVSADKLTISATGSAMTIAENVWNFLAPFAITLTVVYFGIDINKRMVFEGTDVTFKTFAFPFIRLAAALVVVDNGMEIFKALTDVVNGLVEAAEGAFSLDDIWATLQSNELGKNLAQILGFWGLIALLLPLLIAIIVGLICNLIWVYKGFTFKCEFFGRYMLGPIALADVYSGANAAAIRYVKGMIAFALYGVCLVILPKMVMAVAVDEIIAAINKLTTAGGIGEGIGGAFDAMGAILMVVIAPIAGIGVVGAAKSFTREAVGA